MVLLDLHNDTSDVPLGGVVANLFLDNDCVTHIRQFVSSFSMLATALLASFPVLPQSDPLWLGLVIGLGGREGNLSDCSQILLGLVT